MNKNSFNSITNNNLSNSKSKSKSKKIKKIKKENPEYDLLNRRIVDKQIIMLSEQQNNKKYKKYFFKNKTEKQLLNKYMDTKS